MSPTIRLPLATAAATLALAPAAAADRPPAGVYRGDTEIGSVTLRVTDGGRALAMSARMRIRCDDGERVELDEKLHAGTFVIPPSGELGLGGSTFRFHVRFDGDRAVGWFRRIRRFAPEPGAADRTCDTRRVTFRARRG
ncbi:MAG TPA: hypothetical protein VFR97_15930 [Capillimicrobium sp.]|nr:hypothetical protein [Capillimicrobium sp.]